MIMKDRGNGQVRLKVRAPVKRYWNKILEPSGVCTEATRRENAP